MKSLLVPDMKLNRKFATFFTFCVSFVICSVLSFGQSDSIPMQPKPPRLVNDFADLLTPQEKFQLEHKLVSFNDSTSTQIAVVIVKSLRGYEPNDMATRIIEKWGIGQKGKNNGILVLVKVKTQEEKGQIYISTGYGVESFVTDALSKRIVEMEVLPSFRQNRYYEGLDKATTTLMSLVKGQFTADQYMKKKSKKHSNFPFAAIVIIVIIAIAIFGKGSGGRNMSSGGSNIPFWLLMGGLLGGNRSGGFGDFSSGGGDSGGDFGGFGGGSGGGGGAGGEW